MLGFLNPWLSNLTREELETQRAYLCGLCKRLSSEYGTLARLFTTHEGSLLYIVYDAQIKEKPLILERQRCPINFIRKNVKLALSNDAVSFAAAVSMLLFAAKLNDDIQDEKSMVSKILLFLLKSKIQKAEAILNKAGLRPSLITKKIKEQQILESKNDLTLEEYAEPTALLLADLFAYTSRLTFKDENIFTLSRLGHRLGQIIYFLDSFTDYYRDVKLNCFNSLRLCMESFGHRNFKGEIPVVIKNRLNMIITRNLEDMKSDINNLQLHRNNKIILNMLVTGLQRTVHQTLWLNQRHKGKTYTAKLRTMLKLMALTPVTPLLGNGCDNGDSYKVTPNTDCCGDTTSYTVTKNTSCCD